MTPVVFPPLHWSNLSWTTSAAEGYLPCTPRARPPDGDGGDSASALLTFTLDAVEATRSVPSQVAASAATDVLPLDCPEPVRRAAPVAVAKPRSYT